MTSPAAVLTGPDPRARADAPAPLRVLAFAGSLRVGSYNRALLRAARALAPDLGMEVAIHDLDALPFFNADVEAAGDPPSVAAFKAAIRAADAVLIATPEYNDGIPGVLTTALDWATRVPGRSAVRQKPAAILGANEGMTGTARAQSLLRQLLGHAEVYTLLKPEVLIAAAHEKFVQCPDGTVELADEPTRARLRRLLEALRVWAARVGA